METFATQSQPNRCNLPSMPLPLHTQLAMEIFSNVADAEARFNYWQSRGHRNLWLHMVRHTCVQDMRSPLTVDIPLESNSGRPVYVLVRLS